MVYCSDVGQFVLPNILKDTFLIISEHTFLVMTLQCCHDSRELLWKVRVRVEVDLCKVGVYLPFVSTIVTTVLHDHVYF